MAIFAVNYHYNTDDEGLAEVRPMHREWLAEHLANGNLLASGPLVHNPGALLIWRADSLEQLAELLDLDPFDIGGYLEERVITEWNPVFGPWS